MVLLPAFAIALLVAIWAAVPYQIGAERQAAHNEAVAHSHALARVLSEHVSHILRQSDHATQLFKLKYEETGGALRLAEFTRRGGLFDSVLPARLELPMALIDRHGKVRDRAHAFPPADVASQEYFRALARGSADSAIFSTPLVDQRTGKWQIQVTRRLNDRGGAFAGVIVLMIDPLLFVDDYDRLHLDDNGALVLLSRTAPLAIARVGETIFISSRINFAPRDAAAAASGEVLPNAAPDHTVRIYSASAMPRYGMMAVVGISEQEAMAGFAGRRTLYLQSALAATLLIVLVVSMLMKQSARLRASIRAAREAQATLRAAADGSLDAVMILKASRARDGRIEDFIIADINDKGAAMLGCARAQLMEQRVFTLLPRFNRTGFFLRYVEVLDSGKPLEEEVELRHDGDVSQWIHHQIVPIPDGVAVTTRDISARKHAEFAIRSSEAQLAAVTNASPLGLIRTDLRGSCSYVNRMFETITGLTSAQALGSGWIEALHPEDRIYMEQLFAHQRKNDEPFKKIVRCQHADGSLVWTSLKVAAVRMGGRITGFVGSIDDITTLREAEMALRESEARLRTIADTLPAMVAYVDANLVYRFHNLAYDREFGRAGAEMPGKTVRETVGEARYRKLEPYIERALTGETLMFEEYDEIDGIERTLEVTYVPQRAEDGVTVVGFHVMRQDITSQKREKKRLLKLAQVDTLTGVSNRAGFLHKLSEAMRDSAQENYLMAVMYMDIDHFKPVNDTHGHKVGDDLLKAFAARLSQTLRASDTVARLGGDEFTIIMERLGRADDAEAIAAKIVAAMREPFELDEVTVSVTVSIGLAYFSGGAPDPDALLKQADMQLYQAKQAGRDTYRAAA